MWVRTKDGELVNLSRANWVGLFWGMTTEGIDDEKPEDHEGDPGTVAIVATFGATQFDEDTRNFLWVPILTCPNEQAARQALEQIAQTVGAIELPYRHHGSAT